MVTCKGVLYCTLYCTHSIPQLTTKFIYHPHWQCCHQNPSSLGIFMLQYLLHTSLIILSLSLSLSHVSIVATKISIYNVATKEMI